MHMLTKEGSPTLAVLDSDGKVVNQIGPTSGPPRRHCVTVINEASFRTVYEPAAAAYASAVSWA
jgi:hypothetical protein